MKKAIIIAGGFISTIDRQIQSEVDECHVPGSGITVGNMIKHVEKHQEHPSIIASNYSRSIENRGRQW